MINKNAIACTRPCQVAGLRPASIGVSTLKAASISATPSSVSITTPKLLALLCGS
jgi:hypothetical protein